MEKEVKPYYEDDYQALDEVDTVDLLEMKEGALNDLNESERTIQPQNWQHDLRNKAGFPNGSKPKGEKSFAP